MRTQVAQQGKDGVPAREEDKDSAWRLQALEVCQQGSDEIKGDVFLRHLRDGELSGGSVGLTTVIQFLLCVETLQG